jgi:hypothetical protein
VTISARPQDLQAHAVIATISARGRLCPEAGMNFNAIFAAKGDGHGRSIRRVMDKST